MTNKKIVIIGGGTGQAVFLYGLKHYTNNITAVVPVTDNGSSSGMLREDLGMLPPGDIRSCLLALAETEPTMETIFQYRFDRGRLKGQSLGNMFIAAMTEIYGSFENAGKNLPDLSADVITEGSSEERAFVIPENPRKYAPVLSACAAAAVTSQRL